MYAKRSTRWALFYTRGAGPVTADLLLSPAAATATATASIGTIVSDLTLSPEAAAATGTAEIGTITKTQAALSLVGHTLNDLANVTSRAVAVPSGTANGDMMLLAISHAGAVIVTAPAGWTIVHELGSNTQDGLQVYSRVASSEPADYTVTYSNPGNCVESIIAYRSPGGAALVVDVAAETDSTTPGTSHLAPSVTTTRANAQLICFTSWSGIEPSGGLTADGSMTERYESSSGAVIQHCMDKLIAAAGATGTKSVSNAGVNSRTARLISVAIVENV